MFFILRVWLTSAGSDGTDLLLTLQWLSFFLVATDCGTGFIALSSLCARLVQPSIRGPIYSEIDRCSDVDADRHTVGPDSDSSADELRR